MKPIFIDPSLRDLSFLMVGNHLLQLIRRNAIQVLVTPPAIPVGKIKSFGALGPKYEVGHALRQLEDGDWMVEVTLVESGEKVEYRWTRLSDDPEAH